MNSISATTLPQQVNEHDLRKDALVDASVALYMLVLRSGLLPEDHPAMRLVETAILGGDDCQPPGIQ